MASKQGHQDNAGAALPPVPLEEVEFLRFENLTMKLAFAQREVADIEAQLQRVRSSLVERYGVTGTWRVDVRSGAPSGAGLKGEVYYDSSNGKLYIYNGSAWTYVSLTSV